MAQPLRWQHRRAGQNSSQEGILFVSSSCVWMGSHQGLPNEWDIYNRRTTMYYGDGDVDE